MIVAGNWKMNTSVDEGIELIKQLKELISKHDTSAKEVITFPPFTHLWEFGKQLSESQIFLGAQNFCYEPKGAFTGEISATMLKSCGCNYVLIGHSERRQYFNESNELLAKKLNTAIENELLPIYCCGESLEEREAANHFKIIEKQINEGVFHLNENNFKKVVIAYEPIWAIGTGKTASPEQAQEIHNFIRSMIEKKYDKSIAENTSILYGGSVKASNAKEIFAKADIDGGLIGGASLKPEEFNNIINSI